jgi:hypothetical protein
MSRFGEKLVFDKNQAECPHTGEKYMLEENKVRIWK